MSTPAKFNVEHIPIEGIFTGAGRRAVNERAVADIMRSIELIGLQTPITVRFDKEYADPDTGEVSPEYVLIAGMHRLESFRRLGLDRIPAIIRECSAIEAELWEIAENLHRADLTKEERDEQIRRYAALMTRRDAERDVQSPQLAAIESKRTDGRGHRPEGIAAKVAAETGVSKDTVERAINPERAAKERAKRADKKILRDEAEEKLAQILAECVPGHYWDALKANLRTAGCKRVAEEFDRLVGVSVFDRSKFGAADQSVPNDDDLDLPDFLRRSAS